MKSMRLLEEGRPWRQRQLRLVIIITITFITINHAKQAIIIMSQAGPSLSLASGTDEGLEASTGVARVPEEPERVRLPEIAQRVEGDERVEEVEEVEGGVEDFTSILLPVDSKERRVVLRRVSLTLFWDTLLPII